VPVGAVKANWKRATSTVVEKLLRSW
jgi:hypothetical protein